MAEQKKSKELKIKDSFVGSIYAQFVVVTTTDIDITLNFVYINPRDNTQGQVISRVTLPRPAGEDVAKTILTTVKMHEEKRKEKKDGSS
jgi:hypothetical protein